MLRKLIQRSISVSPCVYRRNGRVYWECTYRRCKGDRCSASVVKIGDQFRRGSSSHNHEATAGLESALVAKKSLKKHAKKDMFAAASTLVSGIVSTAAHDNLPNTDNMVCVKVVKF